MFHDRTKYLNVKVNFKRDCIEEKQIKSVKISTHDNPTDMLTKALPLANSSFAST